MLLTHFIIFKWMCGFISGFQANAFEVIPGSDVSLRCDVSLLSESSTLQWEKDGVPTSNTTLTYNNSAYIILHTVDKNNAGEYYCRLIEDGRVQTVRNYTLSVKTNSYTGNTKNNNTIYRQSSSISDATIICKSSTQYASWRLTLEQRPNSQIDLITVKTGGKVQVKGPIKPGNLSSTTHNSQAFTLQILPVRFNYSGTYRCITEKGTYTTTILHTIRVSVEPSEGVLRHQSVLLTCELSEVTKSVTLVWLKMEGDRGVLEKQNIVTKNNNKLQLTVNMSNYTKDPLQWQCAVFTENKLRALAPAINDSSTTTATIHEMNKHAAATVWLILTLFTGILLVTLLYYCYKKRKSVQADAEESEPVYINISQMRNDRAKRRSTVGIREKSPETYHHTRSHEKTNMNIRNETPVTDNVTYATVYFNKYRIQT